MATSRIFTKAAAAAFALAVACCTCGAAVVAWANQDVAPDVDWYLDDPQAEVFHIRDGEQLAGLAQLVNGTARDGDGNAVDRVDFAGKTVVQENDLVMFNNELSPIGADEEHAFAGTYDGNGHTLRGFRLSARHENVGVFGVTAKGSLLKDITLRSSSIYSSSVSIGTADKTVRNVGTVVGYAKGDIENCSSKVPISITSETQATEKDPVVISHVGGIAGYALGDVSDSSFTGSLAIKASSDSVTENLCVVDSVGGVVGRAGDPHEHGTVRGCKNTAPLWVLTTGAGEKDRFGVATYARSMLVGGVVGFAEGDVVDCQNGDYDSLHGAASGTVQTSATSGINGEPIPGRGGDEVGGIVGSLRGESDDPTRFNDGDPDDPVEVRNCHNLGTVVGCCATGGICGQAGVYCTVTQCRNGIPDDEEVGHVVTTRWNKPSTGGILGQGRGGSANYCANYALVENIQTGYYTAGIVGSLYYSDDYSDADFQVYACFNSGHIYTASRDEDVEYREAGIVGYNEGYVHDCVMLYGTVPFHWDSPIGASDWGMTSDLHVLTQDEMQSSYCAALLNATADGWDVYWYMNSYGYPVLNIWEDPYETVDLTPDIIASVEILAQAGYIGPGIEPYPTLSITLTNGRRMWQNTDFYVVPQKGAWEVSRDGETPYAASIVGLGTFSGRVDNVVNYGIGKGDLSRASVITSTGKYALGKPSFPKTVKVLMAGNEVDPDSYSYRIYDYATTTIDDNRTHYVVYDSEGYAVVGDSRQMVPVAQADLSGGFVLYDRNRTKISDSASRVYDPQTGAVVQGRYSCSLYRSGSPAGYLVEVSANTSAVKFNGSAYGRYSVATASLKDDVEVSKIEVDGQEWLWDADSYSMYTVDADGVAHTPRVTFTGKDINPVYTLTYLGQELVLGEDYRVIYGDPNGEGTANRDATTEGSGAGATVRSADTSRFSNYLTCLFEIAPAALDDCKITLNGQDVESTDLQTFAFTGTYVEPEVDVTLDGVKLVAGRDYTIDYANNLRSGTASFTVTALNNLSGGQEKQVTGKFKIGRGVDISQYKLADLGQTYFNFGLEPKLDIALTDKEGRPVDLVRGKDYTVSLSSCSIGTSTVTVTGIGIYEGQVSAKVAIRPLDVEADPYDQVRYTVQDMSYGTWKPEYNSTAPRYQIGSDCPVQTVELYPVEDWATMTYATTPYTNKSTNTYIGNVVARYYDASGREVTFQSAAPGTLSYSVDFSFATLYNNTRVGCAGSLTGTVEYLGGADIATSVSWGTDGASTYTGQPLEPVVGRATGSGAVLVEGRDYKIAYEGNVDVGVASYTVEALPGSDYAGSYSSTFSILPVDLGARASVKKVADQAYTGFDVEPRPVVRVDGVELAEGRDYTLSYMHNVEPGRARVYISGKGNYGGRTSADYRIVEDGGQVTPLSMEDVDVTEVDAGYPYTGSAIRPQPTVKKGGVELEEGVDYTASFEDNVKVGTAAIVLTGMGAFEGDKRVEFQITPSQRLADEEAAAAAAAKIAALPAAGRESATDAAAVATARAAYDALTPAQKALVGADAATRIAAAERGVADAKAAAERAERAKRDSAPVGGVKAGVSYRAGSGATAAVYAVVKPATPKAAGTVRYVRCAAAKGAKAATVPATVKIKGGDYRVVAVGAKAFKGFKKLKRITVGANVATLAPKAFAGAPKLQVVTVKSKLLVAKANVKNCLKSSKVAKVKLSGLGAAKKKVKAAFTKYGGKKKVKVS